MTPTKRLLSYPGAHRLPTTPGLPSKTRPAFYDFVGEVAVRLALTAAVVGFFAPSEGLPEDGREPAGSATVPCAFFGLAAAFAPLLLDRLPEGFAPAFASEAGGGETGVVGSSAGVEAGASLPAAVSEVTATRLSCPSLAAVTQPASVRARRAPSGMSTNSCTFTTEPGARSPSLIDDRLLPCRTIVGLAVTTLNSVTPVCFSPPSPPSPCVATCVAAVFAESATAASSTPVGDAPSELFLVGLGAFENERVSSAI
mmetsp:Transcript_32162/g.72556  ORF Transcript_32162/g.72556 Transcript_32162/m.72556 type:complete len:256 (+) Transcript_32162:337-1104(+)